MNVIKIHSRFIIFDFCEFIFRDRDTSGNREGHATALARGGFILVMPSNWGKDSEP